MGLSIINPGGDFCWTGACAAAASASGTSSCQSCFSGGHTASANYVRGISGKLCWAAFSLQYYCQNASGNHEKWPENPQFWPESSKITDFEDSGQDLGYVQIGQRFCKLFWPQFEHTPNPDPTKIPKFGDFTRFCVGNEPSIELGLPRYQNPTKRRLGIGLGPKTVVLFGIYLKLNEIGMSNCSPKNLNQSWRIKRQKLRSTRPRVWKPIWTPGWMHGVLTPAGSFGGPPVLLSAARWYFMILSCFMLFLNIGIRYPPQNCRPCFWSQWLGTCWLDGTEGMNHEMWPPRTAVTDFNCCKGTKAT